MLRQIFIALILDILAFTVILPLFPKLMEFYHDKYLHSQDDFYGWTLSLVGGWWKLISPKHADPGRNMDIVLVGGALGSLFALLQFLSSPVIGRLSDRYGRKSTLLVTMIGNILSASLWLVSSKFALFVLSRVIGGLSEGNVQLSIAMITDITDETTRSKGLSLVGIAFALGFTFGPAIGAFFASFELSKLFPQLAPYGLNSFSTVALLCMILLVVETVYIYLFIPETLEIKETSKVRAAGSFYTTNNRFLAKRSQTFAQSRFYISLANFCYLFFFSGIEFTLTFLTYERFKYSNMQQGKLLGYIGILSSIIQGGYVRRMAHQVGESMIVFQGLLTAAVASLSLAIVGTTYDPFHSYKLPIDLTLWLAGICFAFASATVVNGFTALYSMTIESTMDTHKGEIMGKLRSSGQLGRSLGPIVICSLYWRLGSVPTYLITSAGIFAAFILARKCLEFKVKEKTK